MEGLQAADQSCGRISELFVSFGHLNASVFLSPSNHNLKDNVKSLFATSKWNTFIDVGGESDICDNDRVTVVANPLNGSSQVQPCFLTSFIVVLTLVGEIQGSNC